MISIYGLQRLSYTQRINPINPLMPRGLGGCNDIIDMSFGLDVEIGCIPLIWKFYMDMCCVNYKRRDI